ncbi:hypothetical protein ONZ45_g10354 [Pleurotus djamor]|nr:hypothetical protein ONZ45_g10354 [Pleurotus djamor]
MSAPAVAVPAQENMSIQVTEKPLSQEVSTGLSPVESPSRHALLPTQDGVATDDNHNNSVIASTAVKAQVEPAAVDEKQENDGGKKKAIAKTKKSARIAQSKNKKQAEEKGKELPLPEGARIICQDYGRPLCPIDPTNAESAPVAPASDAVVDEVKDVVAAGAKTKKTAARRKSAANLRASSSKDDAEASQPSAAAVKKAGRVNAKATVANDVDAAPQPSTSTKTKKSAAKKSVADTDAPAKPKPKAAKGKKVAAKKEVVPSISVRAPAAGKGKGKAKEIKLSRFAPVEEGSSAVKRKAPEDDEAVDEDCDADDDGVRRPSKRAKVVT